MSPPPTRRLAQDPSPTELREIFHRRMDGLVREASGARLRARSYRGFHVGCALLAFDPGARHPEEELRLFSGANSKVSPDAKKVCAEADALQRMGRAGSLRLVGLVVLGAPQVDERSGVGSLTLHPCEACRALLENQAGDPSTVQVLTVSALDPRVREIMTLDELLTLHRRSEPARLAETRNP